jgi:hypothetical protein
MAAAVWNVILRECWSCPPQCLKIVSAAISARD